MQLLPIGGILVAIGGILVAIGGILVAIRGILVARLMSRFLDTQIDSSIFNCIGMLCPNARHLVRIVPVVSDD